MFVVKLVLDVESSGFNAFLMRSSLTKQEISDATFFLLGQLPEDLAQMPSQTSIQYFSPALRDRNYMVLALPFRVA
jgi:hypothetical protein